MPPAAPPSAADADADAVTADNPRTDGERPAFEERLRQCGARSAETASTLGTQHCACTATRAGTGTKSDRARRSLSRMVRSAGRRQQRHTHKACRARK
eukprot:352562-Chlamydomonas_euryale.AAC.4